MFVRERERGIEKEALSRKERRKEFFFGFGCFGFFLFLSLHKH